MTSEIKPFRLMKVGAQECEIAVAEGTWVVVSKEQVLPLTDARGLVALLPLLEQPYEKVRNELQHQLEHKNLPIRLVDTFPFGAIVKTALGWPTEYWIRLALEWLPQLGGGEAYQSLLKELVGRKGLSQQVRHKARSLSKGTQVRAVCSVPSPGSGPKPCGRTPRLRPR